MKYLGILAALALLSICYFTINDYLKNWPPSRYYGKDKLSKFMWFSGFIRWGIIPTLIFIGVLFILLK